MVSICYQLMSFILLTQSSFPGHQHLQKSSNNVSLVFLFLTPITIQETLDFCNLCQRSQLLLFVKQKSKKS